MTAHGGLARSVQGACHALLPSAGYGSETTPGTTPAPAFHDPHDGFDHRLKREPLPCAAVEDYTKSTRASRSSSRCSAAIPRRRADRLLPVDDVPHIELNGQSGPAAERRLAALLGPLRRARSELAAARAARRRSRRRRRRRVTAGPAVPAPRAVRRRPPRIVAKSLLLGRRQPSLRFSAASGGSSMNGAAPRCSRALLAARGDQGLRPRRPCAARDAGCAAAAART